MTDKSPRFRPEIGQSLFMGYSKYKPEAVTVTGFHRAHGFSSEQVEYTVLRTGKKDTGSLDSYTFFPDAPLDSKFVYCVVQASVEDNCSIEEAYFFEPQPAFDHIDALESGAIKPSVDIDANDRAFRVEVEKI